MFFFFWKQKHLDDYKTTLKQNDMFVIHLKVIYRHVFIRFQDSLSLLKIAPKINSFLRTL